jgi:hypothetical protein
MRNFDDEEDDGAGWRYADVDLKPMMSIICVLIPILIFAFSFFEIKVQPIVAPKVGFGAGKTSAGANPDEEMKTPLNLTVLLTDKGYSIKQTGPTGAITDTKVEKKQLMDKDGNKTLDYDYPLLYEKLVEIKKAHPDEKTVNIGAESRIPFGPIAKTLDAARMKLAKDKFETYVEYADAKEAMDEEGKPIPLFPQASFVVAE